jgi:nucleotide-binding universal stress UspA family protein
MTRFNRIVCPIDFSDYSQRALDYAMAIARWHHSHVWALHVHQLATPAFAAAPALAGEAFQVIRLSDAEREELTASLRGWVATDAVAGVAVEAAVEEEFNVPETIVSYAAGIGADLITLATHGRSGFKKFVLGSVTEKVLRTAPCAVLVVPPHAPDAVPRAPIAFSRIVCPVDFSKASQPAVAIAASLAAESGGRLTVAHIVEMPSELSDVPTPDLLEYRTMCFERARRCLKTLTSPLRQICGVDELLLAGTPSREIVRLAGEQQADLIVIGVQGRGAIDRALFGSVTQHVVRQAACAVLTVPAAE